VLLERLQAAEHSAVEGEEEALPALEGAALEGVEAKVRATETPTAVGEARRGSAAIVAGAEKGVTEMTDEERRLARAKRFGMVTKEVVQEKKKARAERFGIPPTVEEKKAERARRFGLDAAEKASAGAAKANAPSKAMQVCLPIGCTLPPFHAPNRVLSIPSSYRT
jgi:hypothetical protein